MFPSNFYELFAFKNFLEDQQKRCEASIREANPAHAMRGQQTRCEATLLVYLLNSCKCYILLKEVRPKASFALKDDERSLLLGPGSIVEGGVEYNTLTNYKILSNLMRIFN